MMSIVGDTLYYEAAAQVVTFVFAEIGTISRNLFDLQYASWITDIMKSAQVTAHLGTTHVLRKVLFFRAAGRSGDITILTRPKHLRIGEVIKSNRIK